MEVSITAFFTLLNIVVLIGIIYLAVKLIKTFFRNSKCKEQTLEQLEQINKKLTNKDKEDDL
ncbi:hypothetical protein [Natranaerobius trueperi]|uniref:DUF4083 domain-containing protein n=1 Tax=Natranaerobius trueperi TaxID=759412 RepID=A0A226BXL7_9FIRM|nr:hypothetical protein [Natranaerobius trueperi]OWZ82890.1 hypothetical protein CDO51_11700 [Natranaerobius trueperi]